ncbi:putative aminophospholipid-translocase, partial [Cryomyces antarcticus]
PRHPLPGALQGADRGPLAQLPHLLRLARRLRLPGLRHPGPVAAARRHAQDGFRRGRRGGGGGGGGLLAHGRRQLHRPRHQRARHGRRRSHHLAPGHALQHPGHRRAVFRLAPLPGRLLRPRLRGQRRLLVARRGHLR